MASVNRHQAMTAQVMLMACATAFNGDKAGIFSDFIERLLTPPESHQARSQDAITSDKDPDEAEAEAQAALLRAQKIFAQRNQ